MESLLFNLEMGLKANPIHLSFIAATAARIMHRVVAARL